MDTLIGLLQNPLLLTGLGILVKFFPRIRTVIANRAIPYLNMAVAFVGALLALATGAVGAEVKPAMFASWYPEHMTVAAAGFGGAFGGLFGCLKSAVWNAGFAYIINKLAFNQITVTPADSRR
jgi:hypothetical protein